MKTFEAMAAQGDVMLRRIKELPDGLVAAAAENGAFILAHSETGHHHVVMERPDVKLYTDPADQFRAFLNVQDAPAELKHQRDFDTHEPLCIPPGIYEVRRQREYVAEGFRRAQD